MDKILKGFIILIIVLILWNCENSTKVDIRTYKSITEFTFSCSEDTVCINETTHTIAVKVPFGRSVTALTPIVKHTGVSISPDIGIAQDFTNPVIYTVKAVDNSTQAYKVTVTVGLDTSKAITEFTFSGPKDTVSIDETTHTIAVKVPFGTSVTALTPIIKYTGVNISPDTGKAQDFTNPLVYTVRAADSSIQAYKVAVTVGLDTSKAITEFTFSGPKDTVSIDEATHTIAVKVPFGTSVIALTPIVKHTGVSINPDTGKVQDFTNPMTYTVRAADSSTQAYKITVTVGLDTSKAITEFNFSGPGDTATINETTHQIAVKVPFGTSITALKPIVKHTGVSIDPDTGKAQDFTNPVTYTIRAADSSTQAYKIAVTVGLDTSKAITEFTFSGSEDTVTINEAIHTIAVKVPFGTSVTALTPIVKHTGVSINPDTGKAQDFTNPVTYTVRAADSSTQVYTITVNVGLDTSKAITEFNCSGPKDSITINETTHTITVKVPFGTTVTALKPIVKYTGISISPDTGVAQDFTNPVTYIVRAADSSTQAYTITVTVGLDTSKAITEFKFSVPGDTITINEVTHAIAVKVPFGTSVTSLKPIVKYTGVSISPDTGVSQDFTNPVTYILRAADSSTQAYIVAVVIAKDTSKAITAFSIASPEITATINEATHTIAVKVPFGTSVTSLKPIIKHTGVSISPDTGRAQDFTSPVTYTVNAADSSTQVYKVTVAVAEKLPAKLKVLFLGNSITFHPRAPQLGWYGDWGMAASCQENDYVHVLISKLKANFINTSFDFRVQNVGAWELNFLFDPSNFEQVIDYNPDILISKIGENISEEYARGNNYYVELTKFLKFYAKSSTKVIVTGNIWPNQYKDSVQKSISFDNGWEYIDFGYLILNDKNFSYGLFEHPGVAAHPSDTGMKEIALSMYQTIQQILLNW